MALVLTKPRVIQRGAWAHHVPVGSVLGTILVAHNSTFSPPADAKLIPAGTYKPGDIVEK